MSGKPVSRLPPPPLTPAQRGQLVEMSKDIARWIAHFKRKYRGLLEPEDVGQLVNMAAGQAVRTWRAECNVPVEMYAWKHVNGVVIRAARDEVEERDAVREAAEKCMNNQRDEGDRMNDTDEMILHQAQSLSDRVVAAMVFSLATASPARDAEEGEEQMADLQMRAKVRSAVANANLLERELTVLEMHYVKDCEFKEIAEALQIGYSSVRRIHNEALTSLREQLCAMGITELAAMDPAARGAASREPDKSSAAIP